MTDVRIAVVGVGLIGRRHVEAIRAAVGVKVAALVDPADTARKLAEGVPWYRSVDDMPPGSADGVIVATPNTTHVDVGLACVTAGLPVLVEKPVATDVVAARRLVDAAAAAKVPLVVGHHRRHNPLIAAARDLIASGRIGRIVAAHGMFWLRKPDSYFDVDWRREPGAGPIFLNLIHDVDLLRHLVGEITAVHAVESNTVRSHTVEESAAIIFEFRSGAVGTFTLSDAIPAPWSWEMTSGENPVYPPTDESCYLLGGEAGSLELPALRVWTHAGSGAWHDPIDSRQVTFEPTDPLIRQVEHFAAVVRGECEPLVSGREGMKTLAVIEAVKLAARDRRRVEVEDVDAAVGGG